MSKEVKISVIKFEMVNGKKTYKSFTFKLNPKEWQSSRPKQQ